MTIEFVSGDLLNPMKEDAIAHGCNCIGVMGAGIAKEIKNKWPKEMMRLYKWLCKEGWTHLNHQSDLVEPGDVQYFSSPGLPVLINMFTQRGIRTQPDGSSPAKLEWIEECLNDISFVAPRRGIKTIGMPRVGAGLGGLDWEDVKALMIKVCEPIQNLHFVVYDHYVPGEKKDEVREVLEKGE